MLIVSINVLAVGWFDGGMYVILGQQQACEVEWNAIGAVRQRKRILHFPSRPSSGINDRL